MGRERGGGVGVLDILSVPKAARFPTTACGADAYSGIWPTIIRNFVMPILRPSSHTA